MPGEWMLVRSIFVHLRWGGVTVSHGYVDICLNQTKLSMAVIFLSALHHMSAVLGISVKHSNFLETGLGVSNLNDTD